MHKIIKILRNILVVFGTLFILILSIWGPEKLASYRDKNTLGQIISEPIEMASEGYKYSLSNNEKLFILAECLSNQVLPETEISEKTQVKNDVDYDELNGTYALVTNYQGPTDVEIKEDEIFSKVNEQLETLKVLGILPKEVKEVKSSSYSADLYSAIDVLEPRNSVNVWKISLNTSQLNADKSNRVLDAYVDGENGKIYEFYVRIEDDWESLEPDKLVEKWAEYLGLDGMELYDTENPLLETTPYFKKYRFPAGNSNSTIVTIGYYEGINELFLKITR